MEMAIKIIFYTHTQMHIHIHQSVIRLQPLTDEVNGILDTVYEATHLHCPQS